MLQFYSQRLATIHFVYTSAMDSSFLTRYREGSGWIREAVIAALALTFGFGLLPLLIFLAGSTVLGRYDGASASRLYASVYEGLGSGSSASVIVVFGPYGLYLIYRLLAAGWRRSALLTRDD